jgi:hypothetical protein
LGLDWNPSVPGRILYLEEKISKKIIAFDPFADAELKCCNYPVILYYLERRAGYSAGSLGK